MIFSQIYDSNLHKLMDTSRLIGHCSIDHLGFADISHVLSLASTPLLEGARRWWNIAIRSAIFHLPHFRPVNIYPTLSLPRSWNQNCIYPPTQPWKLMPVSHVHRVRSATLLMASWVNRACVRCIMYVNLYISGEIIVCLRNECSNILAI